MPTISYQIPELTMRSNVQQNISDRENPKAATPPKGQQNILDRENPKATITLKGQAESGKARAFAQKKICQRKTNDRFLIYTIIFLLLLDKSYLL